MSIEVVALDFDGVLNAAMVFGEWLEREQGISREEQAHFFGGPFRNCTEGKTDMLDVLPPFLGQWLWTGGLDAFMDRWFMLDDNLDRKVIEVVDGLRAAGIGVVLATNQESHRAAYIRKHPNLAGRFNHHFFSCDLGVAKPDARYFVRIANELGRKNGEILFFDDQEANVTAARACGWLAEPFTDVDRLIVDLQRYVMPNESRVSTVTAGF